MYVYVISKGGKPLMPTKRLGKVRHMLKDGKAKVVQLTPFTIQLTYDSKEFTQDITLGVDAGSKTIGLSATTIDARCISGNPQATPMGYVYYQRKVRCHNRKTHKLTINKGGVRKKNQSPKYVFGYQLFDKVSLPNNQVGFIFARRLSGSFDIRNIFGNRVKEITYKKIRLIKSRENIINEIVGLPITTEVASPRSTNI